MQNSPNTSNADRGSQRPKTPSAAAPWGVTWGLGAFALILVAAGYAFRLLAGDAPLAVLAHFAKIGLLFWLGIPAASCAVAALMNRFGGANIRARNAWTLGWLLSVVATLSIMGQYS